MPTYAVRLYNAGASLQAVLTDFTYLEYTRRVNAPGAVNFGISGDHSVLSDIAPDWRVQVQRKRDGASSFNTEQWALFRDEKWSYDERGGPQFEGFSPGVESLLGRRIVNWSAGSTNRTTFSSQKAQTIMRNLVLYNAGASATVANGRKRSGSMLGLSVQADGGSGNTLDWNCHGANLLETLQDLAKVGGGDFSLNVTSASSYEFQFHDGQLGTDRSGSVVFAMEYGNMSEPKFEIVRSKEKTVACVYGQGEGTDRDYVTRTGTNYSSANDLELFVDAKDVQKGSTSALEIRGDVKLDDKEAKEVFSFKLRQIEGISYGDDYDLGDLVKAINPFNGASYVLQIKSITVKLDPDGNEDISVEVQTR